MPLRLEVPCHRRYLLWIRRVGVSDNYLAVKLLNMLEENLNRMCWSREWSILSLSYATVLPIVIRVAVVTNTLQNSKRSWLPLNPWEYFLFNWRCPKDVYVAAWLAKKHSNSRFHIESRLLQKRIWSFWASLHRIALYFRNLTCNRSQTLLFKNVRMHVL